jgi:hypothetical protein
MKKSNKKFNSIIRKLYRKYNESAWQEEIKKAHTFHEIKRLERVRRKGYNFINANFDENDITYDYNDL